MSIFCRTVMFLTMFSVATAVFAQPVPAESTPPAAVILTTAPATTAPATTAPATTAPATTAPATTALAATAPAATPSITVAAPEPIWKSPSFWISVVGGPLFAIILGILVAFGVIGQKQIEFLKRHKIVEIADKVVSQFEKFAAGTKPKWDDVLAQALRAVVDRVGTLTDDQQALVKAVVAERQAQADVKVNGSAVPEEKIEDPKPVEAKPEA